jgi:hypothetical protein
MILLIIISSLLRAVASKYSPPAGENDFRRKKI